MDSDSSENETKTIGDQLFPPLAFAGIIVALAIGVNKTLLWLGVSTEVIRVAKVCTALVFVGFLGWVLVTLWLIRRRETEEKRIQALLEQKTAALLSAPPESKEALSLAAEVDAIRFHLQQQEIWEPFTVDASELLPRLHSYRSRFHSFAEYESQTTQTLSSLGIPKTLSSFRLKVPLPPNRRASGAHPNFPKPLGPSETWPH